MYKDHGTEAAPPHPGEILRDDVLPCLELSAAGLARHLGVTEKEIHALLSEERPVTPELASRLGIAFGQGARYWIALQAQYDGWKAEAEMPEGVQPLTWRKKAAGQSNKSLRAFSRAA